MPLRAEITAVANMRMIDEVDRKDPRTGRVSPAYRVNPSLSMPLKSRLQALTRGEHVSLLSTSVPMMPEEDTKPEWKKECLDCGIMTSSPIARYCEVCRQPLKVKCGSCGSTLDAIYKYCLNCGTKMK